MTFTRALLLALIAAFAVACASSSKKDEKKPDETMEKMDNEEMPVDDAKGNEATAPGEGMEKMKEEGEAEDDDDGGSRGMGNPEGVEPEEEEPQQ